MAKPVISVDAGVVKIVGGSEIDSDNDGKQSVKFSAVVEVSVAELVSEIAKKDLPLLEALLAQVKV